MSATPSLIECLQNAMTAQGSLAADKNTNSGTYNEAKLPYNTRLAPDVDPLAIAFVHSASEIPAVVACARDRNVPLVPRSGGHSYGAYSLGGKVGGPDSADKPRPGIPSVIIDLRGIRQINYDGGSQTVTVGSGAMIGELINALNSNGRMAPTGTCPTVGIGGHALNGGFGLYSRQFGSLADQIVGLDAVLADGRSVHISDSENPDLFYALRGGGSSFAVVHALTFKTQPAPPQVYYYELTLLPRALPSDNSTATRAANFFMAYQEFAQSPAAVSPMSIVWHVAPERAQNGWGTKVEILGQFAGDGTQYNNAINAFKDVAARYGETNIQTETRSFTYNTGGDWSQLSQRGDYNLNEHIHFYAKSYITRVNYALETITNHMRDLLALSLTVNPDSGVEWFSLGPFLGGDSAVKDGTGAFAFRDIKMLFEHYAKRAGSSSVDVLDVVSKMVKSLGPPQATYPAYVDTEIPAGAFPKLLYGDLYGRLQGIKGMFDSGNLFRQPQSVTDGAYIESSYVFKRGLKMFQPFRQVKPKVELEESDLLDVEIDWVKPNRLIRQTKVQYVLRSIKLTLDLKHLMRV